MAYPMSRAVLAARTVPLPTSPVVWSGYAHKTVRACLLVALLWATAVAMLGFFSPLEFRRIFEDVAHFVPALLFVIGLVGALALGHEIGHAFKHVLGYGNLKRASEHHGHTGVPPRGRRLLHASVLVGLLVGSVVAAAIRAASAEWLGFLLLVGIAVVLLLPTLKFTRLALIVWRQAQNEHRQQQDIVAGGERTIATVVAVTNEQFIVENKAMFHVELEYTVGGQPETAQIRFFDYPVWAPAAGNEFDVWFDPERPFVEDFTMIERRYVGQHFVQLAEEPVPGPHFGEADASLLREMESERALSDTELASMARIPQWMADEAHSSGPATPQAARRTRFLICIPPNLIALLSLFGTLLVPVMIEDVPWWTLAALWVYTVLTLINAAMYWQFMVRSRWFIRSGVSFGATEAAVFAGFFAAGFAMITTRSMVLGPLNREVEWTAAHVLTWAAVIGALLVFEWAFTSNSWALKHLNAEFPAPPAAIQEALTGHDPDGIDQLERDYGYRAGVFLCD
ncbi:hypothetical protein [Arthrobacter sp.]|uniref:hypothetical protein n=1 Tax=Arthrobacter sp. TaxID=1667 RepID=UPI0026DFFF84|nr:hypothetical protein [Arthrobacter sp.]MDO5751944.1 hypothetical protein [Arthrobacter sp.]